MNDEVSITILFCSLMVSFLDVDVMISNSTFYAVVRYWFRRIGWTKCLF